MHYSVAFNQSVMSPWKLVSGTTSAMHSMVKRLTASCTADVCCQCLVGLLTLYTVHCAGGVQTLYTLYAVQAVEGQRVPLGACVPGKPTYCSMSNDLHMQHTAHNRHTLATQPMPVPSKVA
jgi:hypothetical protein